MSREIRKLEKPLNEGVIASNEGPLVAGGRSFKAIEPGAKSGAQALIYSLVAHAGIGAILVFFQRPQNPVRVPQRVDVSIVRIKRNPVEGPRAETPKPLEAKPSKRPDKATSQPQSNRPIAPVEPLKGLPKSASTPGATGPAVPVGNTLMTGNETSAKAGEDVKPLGGGDLSSEASLIPASVIAPAYTPDAVDAGLEAKVIVDVMVDSSGVVTQAELRKIVGYGMDEKILEAAWHARFIPRKDAKGRSIEGWTEIKFRLEIPN